MIEGKSKKELIEKLNERFGSNPSFYQSREIAQEFVDLFAKEISSASGGVMGAMRGSYAIRSDEVKLFDAIATALPAAAGVGFVLGGGPALGATVTVGVAIVRLLHRLLTQGVSLDGPKIRLLTILRSNVSEPGDRGMTTNEILEVVQRTQKDLDLAWVERHLGELEAMPTLLNRSTTKIVSQDKQGRWRPHA